MSWSGLVSLAGASDREPHQFHLFPFGQTELSKKNHHDQDYGSKVYSSSMVKEKYYLAAVMNVCNGRNTTVTRFCFMGDRTFINFKSHIFVHSIFVMFI